MRSGEWEEGCAGGRKSGLRGGAMEWRGREAVRERSDRRAWNGRIMVDGGLGAGWILVR